jgi:hypothetical protein
MCVCGMYRLFLIPPPYRAVHGKVVHQWNITHILARANLNRAVTRAVTTFRVVEHLHGNNASFWRGQLYIIYLFLFLFFLIFFN